MIDSVGEIQSIMSIKGIEMESIFSETWHLCWGKCWDQGGRELKMGKYLP